MTAERTPHPELVHDLRNAFPHRPLRRNMEQAKLAIHEAEEKARAAARRRRNRKELARVIALKMLQLIGALVLFAFAMFVVLYTTQTDTRVSVPSYSGGGAGGATGRPWPRQ